MNSLKRKLLALAMALAALSTWAQPTHTFTIGENDFLLDGQRLQIRCGEMHFARVPREYWLHRLKMCKAMGLNAVCAYLFWNSHEFESGKYNWSGQADAAEFCKMAQAEGLWVILRPGPYACAEWDGGGLPWWLLKNNSIQLRTSDPAYVNAARAWLKEVGRVLGPQQVTHGGPILLVQVENEYGSYGKDAGYMAQMRQALIDGGFDVPLFACNPRGDLRNGLLTNLFQVVNFGNDPEGGFKALRQLQPSGPLMCGEFYPGWFDTWGAPHHLGDTRRYLADLEYMLSHNASFSIYMAHGGTTFGLNSGTDRPFKPDTSSYDYDAPISEAGWPTEKFTSTRELMRRFLLPGETLPEPPATNPVIAIPEFTLTESAALFDNLPSPVADASPRNMEAYDQGRGCIVYRTTLPAGPEGVLQVKDARDFAWALLDGKPIAILDRRRPSFRIPIPARTSAARLDILVEAVGHVNFGPEVHDRKGIQGPVTLKTPASETEVRDWQIFNLRLDDAMLSNLKWQNATATGPGFRRGEFTLDKPDDTFLDISNWGKGVVWVNGHCLGRYWNIGPTQTLYLPGPWLKTGKNVVIVLDLLGPEKPTLAGVQHPVLDKLRPELDFSKKPVSKARLVLDGVKPVHEGSFAPGADVQMVQFQKPVECRQFCLESLNAHDGKPFAAIAEIELLDAAGNSIPHTFWTIAYVDSEETLKEDGSALNAINGQTADFWHTEWSNAQPGHPHRIVIDLGANAQVAGFRYTPRPGQGGVGGRIKDYRIYAGSGLVVGK
jgi:beta-galactosidase